MEKLKNLIWKPNKKTLQGFKYGSYIILAPALLLGFILPHYFVLGLLFLYFILKTIVTLRAAATHEIEKEKLEKYSDNATIAKRAYAIFLVIIILYVIGIIFFYFKTEGLLGFVLTIFIATIALPGFFEELIIIKRCQMEQRP